jgi:hypothetical protein
MTITTLQILVHGRLHRHLLHELVRQILRRIVRQWFAIAAIRHDIFVETAVSGYLQQLHLLLNLVTPFLD